MKRFLPVALTLQLFIASTIPIFAGTATLPNAKVLLLSAGTPSNGTNEVQTITFGSGQSSGTFFLRFNNQTTSAITWSATNSTLVSNIDTALEALNRIGASGVTTAVDSMTAGIGTITVTFDGTINAKKNVVEMTVPSKTTSGTIAVTTTTSGVDADGRLSAVGTLLSAAATGNEYVNTGTPPNVAWKLKLGHTTTSLSAADILGLYATPIALVAAPGAGHSITVEKVNFAITRTSTAFASGGVGIIQYASTTHGGGLNAVDSTIASTAFTGSAGLSNTTRNGAIISDSSALDNLGIYMSNQTGAFTTGTGTAVVDVWYTVN